METTTTTTISKGYVGWEEVNVCGEKGRREIHYLLKRKDGGSDLVVIGKEKSLRHMTYRFLLDMGPSFAKLRSRREVVDWLNTFVPDSPSPVSPQRSGGSVDGSEADELAVEMMKDNQLRKLGHYTKEFLWLGSPWTCKRRRKHYQAFRRNGIKISVNEFVYVLAEEDKRLVAYLDDMYEDAKGNKMVVVRWFHKIDEVGIDLPRNYNDREIFFSLCLQDLSIECIDGLATVLSPQHYTKFLKEAKHTQLEPFLCRQQYDNEDLRPLDITQIKGYWKQELFRYMFSLSTSRVTEKSCLPDDPHKKGDISDSSGIKPRKRLRLSRDCRVDLNDTMDTDNMNHTMADNMNSQSNMKCLDKKNNDLMKCGLAQGPVAAVPRKDVSQEIPQHIAVGSLVEVLSQDSGMRGCWFKAAIIKKHKNKVKLRYHDVKDAENEENCLEEWVLASRVAVRDELGIRMYGRTTIRPSLLSHNGKVSWVINVGTVVDVWWHDGWWEGIVIQKEPDEKFRVYFPGEKREAVFCRSDLRHSQEWIGSTWKELNERPDIAASILSNLLIEGAASRTNNDKQPQALACTDKEFEHDLRIDKPSHSDLDYTDSAYKKANSLAIFNLSKHGFVLPFSWTQTKKRKRSPPCTAQKLHPRGSTGMNSRRIRASENHQEFLIPSSLNVDKESCKSVKVDRDNCKYISDSLFGSPVVPSLTSLVMSR